MDNKKLEALRWFCIGTVQFEDHQPLLSKFRENKEILCVSVNINTYYHIITYMRMCRCVCALLSVGWG